VTRHRSGCVQTSAPEIREHVDVGVQQSLEAVHDWPSTEHAAAQTRAVGGPPHPPAQHCPPKAQVPPSGRHDVPVGCWPQRLTPTGSPTQTGLLAQQSEATEQSSPAAPHPPRSSQRPTPSLPTTHEPEQQSASTAHRSQALAQPPAGTHRLTPSSVDRHRREQHTSSPLQTSPTCLEQERPSDAVHVEREAQWDAPLVPATQDPEQQSVPLSQTSPTTRQSARSAHRSETQDPEQHWDPPVQTSPAGAHELAAATQT
jgi:hypothetical protein